MKSHVRCHFVRCAVGLSVLAILFAITAILAIPARAQTEGPIKPGTFVVELVVEGSDKRDVSISNVSSPITITRLPIERVGGNGQIPAIAFSIVPSTFLPSGLSGKTATSSISIALPSGVRSGEYVGQLPIVNPDNTVIGGIAASIQVKDQPFLAAFLLLVSAAVGYGIKKAPTFTKWYKAHKRLEQLKKITGPGTDLNTEEISDAFAKILRREIALADEKLKNEYDEGAEPHLSGAERLSGLWNDSVRDWTTAVSELQSFKKSLLANNDESFPFIVAEQLRADAILTVPLESTLGDASLAPKPQDVRIIVYEQSSLHAQYSRVFNALKAMAPGSRPKVHWDKLLSLKPGDPNIAKELADIGDAIKVDNLQPASRPNFAAVETIGQPYQVPFKVRAAWVVARLVPWAILGASAAIAFYTLYGQNPTFGSAWVEDYLGIFVWGLGTSFTAESLEASAKKAAGIAS